MDHDARPFPLTPTLRQRLDVLLGRLALSYVESLGPMGQGMAQSLTRARGWDLEHLASGNGPLAPVSDRGLEVAVAAFTDELNAALDPAFASVHDYSLAELDAALGELHAALGA